MTENKVVNEFDKRPTYNVGRLLAACQHIQELAAPDLNRTLADAYFRSASQNPNIVLARIVPLARVRLRQVKKIFRKKDMDDLVNRIVVAIESELPKQTNLAEQAAFVLGYYHQRAGLRKIEYGKKLIPTARGDLVRSQGEKLVADTLHSLSVVYEYEEQIELQTEVGGSIPVRPDFSVHNADRTKSLYIEFCGMLDDPVYARKWKAKKRSYSVSNIHEYEEFLAADKPYSKVYWTISELTRDRSAFRMAVSQAVQDVVGIKTSLEPATPF